MKEIVLFGAGAFGKRALDFFGAENVRCFVDNQKYGEVFCEKEVISFTELQKVKDSVEIVIASDKYKTIIAEQLQKSGISHYKFYNGEKKKISEDEFKKEFELFNEKSKLMGAELAVWEDRYPCLTEKSSSTAFDTHYLYHPAWAARILAKIKPEKHVDISSLLDFSAIISAFIPVDYYEYRPVNLNLENLKTYHADLMHLQFEDESIESLSCMHVIEHIGLGRYGDEIDPLGDQKAIAEIKRVVSKKGNVIFAVPIGKRKIMFNAHRVYSYDTIINLFRGFTLKEFALIPDNAIRVGLIRGATKEMSDEQNYGCGCFWFEKN